MTKACEGCDLYEVCSDLGDDTDARLVMLEDFDVEPPTDECELL